MSLQTTPLDALHRELGARMVPFAGYDMPVQYPEGIIREHLHTREAASLFDVSHMGQVVVEGAGATAALESLTPAALEELGVDRQVYTLFTNDRGGVLDDLIVTRWGDQRFFLVVNAGCRAQDIEHLRRYLRGAVLTELDDRALLALQGPAAREIIAGFCPTAGSLLFMQGCRAAIDGVEAYVTCSGYTGEDGFELSIPAAAAEALACRLLADDRVRPAGLGARDSLRLEAGLCLYGHELSPQIDPVQAGLAWAIGRPRRPGGARPGGFPGAEAIFRTLAAGSASRRVGLTVAGRRPVREGQAVLDGEGRQVGAVCSGAYGATVGGPIAMAYVQRDAAQVGRALAVDVRGTLQPVAVTALPFVPPRYFRG